MFTVPRVSALRGEGGRLSSTEVPHVTHGKYKAIGHSRWAGLVAECPTAFFYKSLAKMESAYFGGTLFDVFFEACIPQSLCCVCALVASRGEGNYKLHAWGGFICDDTRGPGPLLCSCQGLVPLSQCCCVGPLFNQAPILVLRVRPCSLTPGQFVRACMLGCRSTGN